MKNGNRFIGMYHTEEELLSAVQELKTKGYEDENIFVLAKKEDDVKMLQRRTDAEIQTTHESLLDKFMDFMTGEDRVRSLMDSLEFSDNERAAFYQDVNNGSMLLYVSEHVVPRENSAHSGVNKEFANNRQDSSTWIAPPDDGVTRPPKQPAFGDSVGDTGDTSLHNVKERKIERSEFTAVADDSLTNGLEVTDFAGELNPDPEHEQKRKEFQSTVSAEDKLTRQSDSAVRGDFFYDQEHDESHPKN